MTCFSYKNPRETAKRLLELINDFIKLIEYKINIQKSVIFLYTNNEESENRIKKTMWFKITSIRINYLGTNLRR